MDGPTAVDAPAMMAIGSMASYRDELAVVQDALDQQLSHHVISGIPEMPESTVDNFFDGENIDPAMFGRDPNPRRNATKKYHSFLDQESHPQSRSSTNSDRARPRIQATASLKRKRDHKAEQRAEGQSIPKRTCSSELRGSSAPEEQISERSILQSEGRRQSGDANAPGDPVRTVEQPTGPPIQSAGKSSDRLVSSTSPTCDQAGRSSAQGCFEPKRVNRGTDPLSTDGSDQSTLPIGCAVPNPRLIRSDEDSNLSIRPVHDITGDTAYVGEMLAVLRKWSTSKSSDVGKRQARRILGLLEVAQPPSATEALFLTEAEAAEYVAPGRFCNNLIVTAGAQRLPLQTIEQFLGEHYDDAALAWVQDPAVRLSRDTPAVRQVTMGQVKARFAPSPAAATAEAKTPPKPWNLLELAAPCDDGLRPLYLNNEDCRLLTKLKIPSATAPATAKTMPAPTGAGRRAYLPGYKEVEKWALLAQAGALTEPHQDSHGYSTFITLNAGCIGFGWLSAPTPAERAAWVRSPTTFLHPGRWRYLVLRPGHTVYFPAGTVHFVFRLPAAGDSLAFGGHVLRCSTLVPWLTAMLEEKRNPAITNEDFTASVPGYVAQVERYVTRALQTGQDTTCAKWGGRHAVEEFLRLKKELLDE